MSRREPFYDRRLGEALRFAADAFAHKERKGTGTPYMTHLLAVTTTVMEHGGSAEQCIAAALHDYLEDIEGSSAGELETRFGPEVTRLVLALSDSTRPGHKEPWKERKLRYLAHLREAGEDVKLVSAADKLHNASSIVKDRARMGDAIFERFTPSKDETLWYYREVIEALSHGWDHALLDELRREVHRLHEESTHERGRSRSS
ncbi:MAG: HD domain-containing protein [Sandaracinus sp.]